MKRGVDLVDRGCKEKVVRGVSVDTSNAGHLSHFERSNYDFAQLLAEKTGRFNRTDQAHTHQTKVTP